MADLENRKMAPKPANRRFRKLLRRCCTCAETYRLQPRCIAWDRRVITPSPSLMPASISIFRRNGLSRLRGHAHIQLYQNQVPGSSEPCRRQLLKFKGKDGKPVTRYQYIAIDDATRICALKIYDRHDRSNATDFINAIIDKLPFRIREVCTDNCHEFQAEFHGHVEDLGIATRTSISLSRSSTARSSGYVKLSRSSANFSCVFQALWSNLS